VARSRHKPRSTLLTTIGVLAALALVAVAARGTTSAGGSGVRRPSELLLDFLVSLYVVLLGLGAVMLVVLFVLRRHTRAGQVDPKRNAVRSLVVVTAFTIAGYFLLRAVDLRGSRFELPPLQPPPADNDEQTPGAGGETYEAEFAWLPMLVLGLLALVGGFAWWRAGKARGRARERGRKPTLAEALADVLAETLESLRNEPDPRRAVIRAYARLERLAAASGVSRKPAEAPLEYLGRLLSGLDVGPAAVRRLTSLFERAKFSHHAIDESMKQEAIAALESVQEDLRQAELRAQQEREAALEELRNRGRERAREQARV
jgi:Domain of unknown function (DUF4129)